MPKKMYRCSRCGAEFVRQSTLVLGRKHLFCSRECFGESMRKVPGCRVYYQDILIPNYNCYKKEARAILEGKNTAFKNKCVKLPGDEEVSD
jgi:DNA-directed RNA polymerase subunit RPC12/RpoP